MAQVVNARRGMHTAGGRRLTTTSTTRMGSAPGGPRLMPEEIYKIAGSRDEAIRLLQQNGYVRAAPRMAPAPRLAPRIPPPAPVVVPAPPRPTLRTTSLPAPALRATPTTPRVTLRTTSLPLPVRPVVTPAPAASLSPRVRRAQEHAGTVLHATGATRTELVEELNRQATLTPLSMRNLTGVHIGGDLFAAGKTMQSAHGYYVEREIRMHHDWHGDHATRSATKHKHTNMGISAPTGSTPMGSTLAHEYGHHVHAQMSRLPAADLRRFAETVRDALGVPVETGGIVSWRSLNDALERMLHPLGAARGTVESMVSVYASSSPMEMLAEIWQEYSTLGAAARPHIRTIGELMRELTESGLARSLGID